MLPIVRWCLTSNIVITWWPWDHHWKGRGGERIMDVSVQTPLIAAKPHGKGVPPSMALDMSGSQYKIIGHLLKRSPNCMNMRVS